MAIAHKLRREEAKANQLTRERQRAAYLAEVNRPLEPLRGTNDSHNMRRPGAPL